MTLLISTRSLSKEISESDINRLLKLAFEKGGKEKYFFLSGVSKSLWGNLNLLAVNWV